MKSEKQEDDRIVEVYDYAGIKRKITMKQLGELVNIESGYKAQQEAFRVAILLPIGVILLLFIIGVISNMCGG